MARHIRTAGTRLLRGRSHGHRSVLVCFHHAGGGMSAFRGWADVLAPTTDVVLVQLKGREDRVAEQLTDRLDDLALEIAEGICALPYDDVVLLGHSMGATVAWAVADAIWSLHRRRVRVVLSAQAPPPYSLGSAVLVPERQDDREGAEEIRDSMGGATTPAVGAFYADILAADLAWMSREFPSSVWRALPVDVYCVAAESDRLLPPGAMAGWGALTTRHFSLSTVPGGHMYLLTDPEPLLDIVKGLALHDFPEKVATVVR